MLKSLGLINPKLLDNKLILIDQFFLQAVELPAPGTEEAEVCKLDYLFCEFSNSIFC